MWVTPSDSDSAILTTIQKDKIINKCLFKHLHDNINKSFLFFFSSETWHPVWGYIPFSLSFKVKEARLWYIALSHFGLKRKVRIIHLFHVIHTLCTVWACLICCQKSVITHGVGDSGRRYHLKPYGDIIWRLTLAYAVTAPFHPILTCL